MNDMNECRYATGFKLWEKVYAQVAFNAMGIAGVVGIALLDWLSVLPYAFLYLFGIPFIVMRHLTCPRCPHLKVYGDCLQLTPAIARRLIKNVKDTPFSLGERILFYAIFALMPLYPLYWLWKTPVLLIIFVGSAAAWYGGQFLFFCKHCRVGVCPFNLTPMRRGVGFQGQ